VILTRAATRLAERLGRFQNGLGGATFSTFTIGLLGAVSGILLARTLGPAPRGEYAAIVLWPTALSIVGELGFNFSISYHCGKGRSQSALWSLTWAVSVGVGGALALAGSVIVPVLVSLPDQAERDLIWAMVTVPAALVTGNLAYMLLGTGRVGFYNWIRVYAAASYSLLIAVLALLSRGNLETYTLAFVFSQLSSALLAAVMVAWALKPAWHWDAELAASVVRYGLKAYASSIAAQLNVRLSQLLMTVFLAAEEVGIYAVAVATAGALAPLFGALGVVTLPRVTMASGRKAAGDQAIRSFQLGMILGLPAMALGIAVSPWVIRYAFGTSFVPAVGLTKCLLVASLFQGLNVILGHSLRGLGQPGKTAVAEGLGLILTVLLLSLTLPRYGSWAAAITTTVVCGTVSLLQGLFVERAAGFPRSEWLHSKIAGSPLGFLARGGRWT
jgi:O-antigen/teichoic acid export membrane protein